MGLLQRLCETYENCESLVGKIENEHKPPLMPIYHITQQFQIEAVIDSNGNFLSAKVIDDAKDRTTLIPCTERSSGVANGRDPHPLFDKLKYLAGDYRNFRKAKKDEYSKYIKRLSDWCASPYANAKVCAVLRYLKKGTLMSDLIRENVLYAEKTGILPEKWTGSKDEIPPVFKAAAGDQADAMVRFKVIRADGAEDMDSRIWEDRAVWKSHIDYQNSLPAKTDYCYVTGKKMPVSEISPKYIRRPGDGAKLISSNDSAGFTYRGRFDTAEQAFRIGRDTTEKAHSALRWLIQRQAYINGDQVILTWRTDGGKTVSPCRDSRDILEWLKPRQPDVTTGQDFAHRFRLALAGYAAGLDGSEKACVAGFDSATPGRLSVFYYRELPEKDLVDRVKYWHETCGWYFPPSKKDGKTIPGFTGAPSPDTIVTAAYGTKADVKLKKSAVQRILPCIIDKTGFPRDIMRCAARRAARYSVITGEDYDTILAAACALIRKYCNDKENMNDRKEYKERWKMSLDPNESDRSYLFGRALAYVQRIEEYALYKAGETRSTNAERMHETFSRHPAKSLEILYHSLIPYLQKLEKDKSAKFASVYSDGLNAVISRIKKEDYTNTLLSELYLLGYSCQMQQFREDFRNYSDKVKNAAQSGQEGEDNK